MPNKTYSFNGVEFTTERNVLKTQNAYINLQMYMAELLKLFTADLDMSAVAPYNQRLKDINDKNKQDKSDLKKLESEETLNTELIEKIKAELVKNQIELAKINDEFGNDETAKAQQTEYNLKIYYVNESIAGSETAKVFLESYLIGDLSKLDYEDPKVIDFTKEVINDFFLSRLPNRSE